MEQILKRLETKYYEYLLPEINNSKLSTVDKKILKDSIENILNILIRYYK